MGRRQCLIPATERMTQAPLVYQLLYSPSEKGEEKWAPIFEFLEAHLAGRDWLVGSELTVADVAVG